MEEWRAIKGYEGLYEVSNTGKVRSKTKRLRTLQEDKDGYLYLLLFKDGHNERKLVHRLVGEAFIPNPHDFPQINHKDGNPQNNFLENLEWVNQSQNNYHRAQTLHSGKVQEIIIRFPDNSTKYFPSLREAEKQTGFSHEGMRRALNNGGFFPKYNVWIEKAV